MTDKNYNDITRIIDDFEEYNDIKPLDKDKFIGKIVGIMKKYKTNIHPNVKNLGFILTNMLKVLTDLGYGDDITDLYKKLDKEERFKGTLAGPLILKKIPTELHCIWKEYNDYVEKGKIYKSINTTSDSIKKTNKKIKQAKLVEPEVSLESNDLIESDEVVDINETESGTESENGTETENKTGTENKTESETETETENENEIQIRDNTFSTKKDRLELLKNLSDFQAHSLLLFRIITFKKDIRNEYINNYEKYFSQILGEIESLKYYSITDKKLTKKLSLSNNLKRADKTIQKQKKKKHVKCEFPDDE